MAITAPTAYWKLDESSGNASDATGNGYTLTNTGTATYTTGKINNCVNFGTANTSKYLTISNNLGITSGACSISCWVKLNTEISSGTYGIVEKGNATDHVQYIIAYEYNGGTRRLVFNRQRQNLSNNTVTYNVTLGTANWYHVVLTYDGTTLKGYVDGSSVGTPLATSGTGASGGINRTDIGWTDMYSSGSYGSLLADECGIWNASLTADEVAKIHNAGRGNQYSFTDDLTTALNVYLKLDETSGNASDSSGNSNTLTNVGTVTYSSAKINNGANFTTTPNQNLSVSNALGFLGGGIRTWSCWVKVSSFASTGYILDNVTTSAGTGSANRRFILYSENDSKIHMFANGNEVLTSTLTTGTWYHLIVTQNGTTWELFLNGVSQGTTTIGSLTYSVDKFYIGESYAGGSGGKCSVDEVGIWLRVLSSTERTDLYNSGSGRQYPFTTATPLSLNRYYKMTQSVRRASFW